MILRPLGLLTAAALLLSACEPVHETGVHTYLPINRLESPEPAPRYFDAGVGAGGMARLQLTGDQRQHAPTDEPPSAQYRGMGVARIEFAPQPYVAAALKVYNGIPTAQLKVMPLTTLGAGTPYSLAATFGYGKYNDRFQYDGTSKSDPSVLTTMKEQLWDYALVGGLRTSPKMLWYGGPFYTHLRYGGDYTKASTTTPYTQLSVSRGFNAGLAWSPLRWMRVMGEVAAADIATGDSSKTVVTPAVSIQMFFWNRREPEAERGEDVRVVPVEELPPAR